MGPIDVIVDHVLKRVLSTCANLNATLVGIAVTIIICGDIPNASFNPPKNILRIDRSLDRNQRKSMKRLRRARRELAHIGKMAATINRRFMRVPVGHFYSPLPDMHDVISRSATLFDRREPDISGVDVRHGEQLNNLKSVMRAAKDMNFPLAASEEKRYYLDNDFYGYLDASCLYGMMKLHRPERIVEVGSGFSSSVMLDLRDELEDYNPELTFIEPFPDRLMKLVNSESDRRCIVQQKVQDTDPELFGQLQPGDFLFIDSSHVSKIGSDVNYLFFEIIPRLKAGVFVHVHDVLWPFEYPKNWVMDGRAWNEAYLLRALLTGNQHLKIYLHLSYADCHFGDELTALLPESTRQAVIETSVINGTGIWLTTH